MKSNKKPDLFRIKWKIIKENNRLKEYIERSNHWARANQTLLPIA